MHLWLAGNGNVDGIVFYLRKKHTLIELYYYSLGEFFKTTSEDRLIEYTNRKPVSLHCFRGILRFVTAHSKRISLNDTRDDVKNSFAIHIIGERFLNSASLYNTRPTGDEWCCIQTHIWCYKKRVCFKTIE